MTMVRKGSIDIVSTVTICIYSRHPFLWVGSFHSLQEVRFIFNAGISLLRANLRGLCLYLHPQYETENDRILLGLLLWWVFETEEKFLISRRKDFYISTSLPFLGQIFS